MGDIVWLASYPKSGNTWTRAFLTKYESGDAKELDINHLDNNTVASSRVLFDAAVGVEASCFLPDEIDNLRPHAFRMLASQRSNTIFLKTHEAWRRSSAGEPLFPANVTRGVVYIVRNPLDVVVSSAHHFGYPIDKAIARVNNEQASLSHPVGGIGEQLAQHLRSWSGHVRSWLDEAALPLYLMRYEDMLADPAGNFGKMVRFAGLAYDEAKVVAAVQATSFESLRRQESAKGFRERPGVSSAPFFREGRAGGWRDHLFPSMVDAIIEAHAEVMQRVGYLDAQGTLLV